MKQQSLVSRIRSSLWNAFTTEQDRQSQRTVYTQTVSYGGSSPHRTRLRRTTERSIIASIYNRISIDVSTLDFKHVRLDESGRYTEDVQSSLMECLRLDPNLDQSVRAFKQDLVLTLLEEGVAAILPVETTDNPEDTMGFDIRQLRVGRVVAWEPQMVRVRAYNELNGQIEEVTLPKRVVGIVENPFYTVMNEPNSTLRRLLEKMNLLDSVDDNAASDKLNLLFHLPYTVRNEVKRQEAKNRVQEIEGQLLNSKHGIAYVDAAEQITQLNRPIENNLFKQVEYLTNLLYEQLGLTPEIMTATADENAMLNYFNKTIEPIAAVITDEMRRKFLSKNARSRGQTITYTNDPFKLVPLANIAEIADKFTRNEIMSSNEIRQIIGIKPSNDPKADELHNSNMPRQESDTDLVPDPESSDSYDPPSEPEGKLQNET